MIVSSDRVLSNRPFNDAPIGIFDSGFGGLTVAREIAKELPEESIVYFGRYGRDAPMAPAAKTRSTVSCSKFAHGSLAAT